MKNILRSRLLGKRKYFRYSQKLEKITLQKRISGTYHVRAFSNSSYNYYVKIFSPAAAGAAAPTPLPTFVIKSLGLMLSKDLANNPGQYGSTSTLAALRIVWIFSPCRTNKMKCLIRISLHFNERSNDIPNDTSSHKFYKSLFLLRSPIYSMKQFLNPYWSNSIFQIWSVIELSIHTGIKLFI